MQSAAREPLPRTWNEPPDASVSTQELEFPPKPASEELRHKIISGFCNDIDPSSFEEAGCTVCGLLARKSCLTPKQDVMFDWDLLIVDDVTRKERSLEGDPIESWDGPVVDELCDYVCTECEEQLLKGSIP
ncbi:hypothetical protein R3P38DRAFT_2571364, partial [Favolaschia claudopus]